MADRDRLGDLAGLLRDRLDDLAGHLHDRLGDLAGRLPHPTVVARVGLGLTILLAGLHKFLAPAAWDAYVLPWLAALLPTSVRTFTLANGVAETAVGLGLVADRWTGPLALVTALSLAGTTGYLGAAAVLEGRFGALAVRDLGLFVLATVVALNRVRD